MYEVVLRGSRQLRVGFGGVYALDFGAVISLGGAMEVDLSLLADVLPDVEAAILSGLRSDAESGTLSEES